MSAGQAAARITRVSARSCGRTLVRPTTGMKLESPPHRGTTCRRTRHPDALGVHGTGAAGRDQYLRDRDGCLSLRNHLAVRDVLRSDAALRDQYAAVKRQPGARAANIDEYGQLKSPVVQKILAAAGLTAVERASIAGNQVPTYDELPR